METIDPSCRLVFEALYLHLLRFRGAGLVVCGEHSPSLCALHAFDSLTGFPVLSSDKTKQNQKKDILKGENFIKIRRITVRKPFNCFSVLTASSEIICDFHKSLIETFSNVPKPTTTKSVTSTFCLSHITIIIIMVIRIIITK